MSQAAPRRTTIAELLETQRYGVLATQGPREPHLSLMAIAATDDLAHLIFVTERDSHKYANLQAHERAALLIDDRANQRSDTEEAVAITAVGPIEEVEPGDMQEALDIFLGRHPQLREFATSSSCALLRMNVEVYSVVSEFQRVERLQP